MRVPGMGINRAVRPENRHHVVFIEFLTDELAYIEFRNSVTVDQRLLDMLVGQSHDLNAVMRGHPAGGDLFGGQAGLEVGDQIGRRKNLYPQVADKLNRTGINQAYIRQPSLGGVLHSDPSTAAQQFCEFLLKLLVAFV